jgi:hypothetical protein
MYNECMGQSPFLAAKMARVLFIDGGSEGHINPTVGVVQLQPLLLTF